MPSILIIEDSESLRDHMKRVLLRDDLRIEVAADAPDALEVLDTFVPDLLITDLNMPRMTGFSFIQQVRKRTGLDDIPILVVTAEPHCTGARRAKEAGANAWLSKPFTPDVLRKSVYEILDAE